MSVRPVYGSGIKCRAVTNKGKCCCWNAVYDGFCMLHMQQYYNNRLYRGKPILSDKVFMEKLK